MIYKFICGLINLNLVSCTFNLFLIRRSGTFCLAIFLIILATGLWPFNFLPKNNVQWLPDRNGVHFYGQGIIVSADPWQKTQESLFPDKSISIEISLRPLIETSHLPHIITLYDGKTPDIFFIGQWRSHLDIQSRTDDPAMLKKSNAYGEIGIKNALIENQDVFISITSGKKGTAIYMNGKPVKYYPRHRMLAGYKGGPLRLIAGNSPAGQSYWRGHLLGLAIYNNVLTPNQVSTNYRSSLKSDFSSIKREKSLIALYPFDEKKGAIIHNRADSRAEMTIPEIFHPVERTILEPPWHDFQFNWSFASDVSINILGFIPFGFFMCVYLMNLDARIYMRNKGESPLPKQKWYSFTNKLGFLIKSEMTIPYLHGNNVKELDVPSEMNLRPSRLTLFYTTYVIAIILGFGFSLSIELLQIYLPTRYSQLTDVICNVTGTLLGIAIFHIAGQRK
jgi:hypothetical protein